MGAAALMLRDAAGGLGRFAANLPPLRAAVAPASRLGSKLAALAGGPLDVHATAAATAGSNDATRQTAAEPSSRLLVELLGSGSTESAAADALSGSWGNRGGAASSGSGDSQEASSVGSGSEATSESGSHASGIGAHDAPVGQAAPNSSQPATHSAATTLPGVARGASAAAAAAAWRALKAAADAPGWALLFLACKTAAAVAVMHLLRRMRQTRAARMTEQVPVEVQLSGVGAPAPQGREQPSRAGTPAEVAGQAASPAGMPQPGAMPVGQAAVVALPVAPEGPAVGAAEAAAAGEPTSHREERSLRQQYGSTASPVSEEHRPGPLPRPHDASGGSDTAAGKQAAASGSVDSEASAGSSSSGSTKSGGGSSSVLGSLSVDASVRLRDISRRGWVQTPAPSSLHNGPPFVNPLFAGPADEQVGSPGGSGSELPSPADGRSTTPSTPKGSRARRTGSSSSNVDGGGVWQVKQAAAAAAGQVGRGRSESLGLGAEDSFRLLAAELPAPLAGSPGGAAAGSPARQPGSPGQEAGASRRGSSDASRPGSPSKPAAGGAARKLTAARSIRPQDVPLPHLAEGVSWQAAEPEHAASAAGFSTTPSAASGGPAAAPAAGRALRRPSTPGAARGLQLELSGGMVYDPVYEAHAQGGTPEEAATLLGSPSRPTSPLTAGMRAGQRGLRLLTARQFQVGAARAGQGLAAARL